MNLLLQMVLVTSIFNFASGLNCYSCTNVADILTCGKEYGQCPPEDEFCAKVIMKDPFETRVIHSCAKRATSDHLEKTPGCYDGKALHNIPYFDEEQDKFGRGLVELEMLCICNTDGCNGSALLKPNLLIFLGFVGFLGVLYKII